MPAKRNWTKDVLALLKSWPGLVFVLIVGIVLGVWASSWLACVHEGCQVNADLVEASGTWVGGVGTIIAVYWAAVSFRHTQESDAKRSAADEAASQAEQADRFAKASEVTLQVSIGGYTGDDITEVRFAVINEATSYVLKLRGSADNLPRKDGSTSRRFADVREVGPGATHTWTLRGSSFGHLRLPEAGRQSWLSNTLDQFVIEFEMAGEMWKKSGNQAVERLR